MSATRRVLTAAVATVSAAVLAVGAGVTVSAQASSPTTDATDTVTTSLTAEQAADLSFTRDEERMALDLWTLFAEEYPETEVFANIAESEQRHFDAVGDKLDQYGLPDPSEGMPPGEYVVPAIQELYDAWEARGLTSLEEALQVGVELETRDIADLEALIAKDNPADIEQVYSNLCDGSYDHLAAFTAVADTV